MKRLKKQMCIVYIMILALTAIGILSVRNKLTYLEYTTGNDVNDTYVEVCKSGEVITQSFEMPYDILHGIGIQTGTFNRDNNSTWVFSIENEQNQVICQETINASFMNDNEYNLIEFGKDIRLKKGMMYTFTVTAQSVTESTALAFYCSEESGDFCYRVYGGDIDYWWMIFIAFWGIVAVLLAGRIYSNLLRGKKPADDVWVMAILTALAVFLILCSYSVTETILDESDNIRGGMIIARGGVLYRDYVTQHTPVTYYLCAVFALLGAKSVQQFRLLYYLFVAVIWGLIYVRNSGYFGRRKMFLLPVLESLFVVSVDALYGYTILSDGIQGICMIVLLLEFVRYYYDRLLGWDRCLIVSACVWGSFGAAFMSVYLLVCVAVAVIMIEVRDWKENEFSIKKAVRRYQIFLFTLIMPLVYAVIYFKTNHALRNAYEQCYLFNREIYPHYKEGYGTEHALQPVITAARHFFGFVFDRIDEISDIRDANTVVLQMLLLVVSLLILISRVAKKKYLESLTLFAVMLLGMSREYEFHQVASWGICILIIVLYIDELRDMCPGKVLLCFAGLASFCFLNIYVEDMENNLFYIQESISDVESKVVEFADEGEEIFLDAYSQDSIYLLYKEHYPVNRAVYMIPWYMDRYEPEEMAVLTEKAPHIVVYNEENREYAEAFADELKKHYKRFSERPEDGWKYRIWVKRE